MADRGRTCRIIASTNELKSVNGRADIRQADITDVNRRRFCGMNWAVKRERLADSWLPISLSNLRPVSKQRGDKSFVYSTRWITTTTRPCWVRTADLQLQRCMLHAVPEAATAEGCEKLASAQTRRTCRPAPLT